MVTKAEINLVRSLSGRSERLQAGLFVAEGRKLVAELPGSDLRIRKLYYTGEAPDIPGVDAQPVSPREMERMSHLKTPTPVLALVEIPPRRFDPAALCGKLTLALDGVQDPGNMGTIIRLADWFGIGDMLCGEGSADCFNPKAVQATMGAITRVRVHYGDLPRMLGGMEGPVYGTLLEGENIYGAHLTPGGVIVMGSEGRGLSPGVAAAVGRQLFIPPYPAGQSASESLNVAVATAIVCSEFRRRM